MKELTLRNERVFREITRDLQTLAAGVREGRDERRAQTQALWRMIDRMDRLDPGGAAA